MAGFQRKHNYSWIITYTGRRFWPLDPEVRDIDIEDIAHSLSMQCRFTGHVVKFYSVAEHSFLVSRIAEQFGGVLNGDPNMLGLWGLLHDASEAYLSDVAHPIKHDPEFKKYRAAEKKLQAVIARKFHLPVQEPAIVHRVDRYMGELESRMLRDTKGLVEDLKFPEWLKPESFVCMEPRKAEEVFIIRFLKLQERIKNGG